ncbi:MAG: 3-alpha,7-alpha,12-alpha-trihydroxy-5-beta-cholest-24-enoyl-CoA hydratase [Acidimicrobiia bacterium]|nr:MAG: 3-alpha,7-alpha,12-alpha-trihydroxy-5-beta-cholest-24-enoyl-CoA hydratase [Acidimicrobiia bacterium]
MPIDVAKVVGAELPRTTASWDRDDVILYHLGLGAGVPPTDPGELEYCYEGRLKVLPTFGVLPVFSTLTGLVGLDGMDFNPVMLLHGEQEITVHKPLPVRATVTNTGRVEHVYDKGKGATVVVVAETRDERGEPLCTNRFVAFIRGEGGFGGDPGPAPANEPPDRDPDLVAESPTLPQQALIYRLSGDKNPLHVDPDMARLGGFDTPILHGLCSYGIVAKAVVDHALDGDVTRVAGFAARFGGVAYPGETLVTKMWRTDRGIVVHTDCKERGTKVVTNALMTVR